MDKKQELLNLIKNSNLEETDKKEWETFIDVSPVEIIDAMSDVLGEYPDELDWFNAILKRKKKANALLLENAEEGQKALSEIYKEEAEKIQSLLAK